MTLILGMSKPEGIYLSADYRVTEYPSGRLIDDVAVKFLTVHYPPHDSGPKALIAYTGLAVLSDGTPMGTWLRETLRGETEFIDQSMALLRARLDRDVAGQGIPLMVNVLVLEPNRRLFGGFSNLAHEKDAGRIMVLPSFGYLMQEVDTAFMFANGSGATRALTEGHLARLQRQLSIRPRKPMDHMKLLAKINRSVALDPKGSAVSPHCSVSFINADDRTSPTSHAFLERGEHVPFSMPMLLFGIDLTDFTSAFHAQSEEFFRTKDKEAVAKPTDVEAALNEGVKRRP